MLINIPTHLCPIAMMHIEVQDHDLQSWHLSKTLFQSPEKHTAVCVSVQTQQMPVSTPYSPVLNLNPVKLALSAGGANTFFRWCRSWQ